MSASLNEKIDDALVLSIIERGLDALGESPKQALWFYLEDDFGFIRNRIPQNIWAFQTALQKFFGLGYSYLDALFRLYLKEAAGINLENYSNFAECIDALNEEKPANSCKLDSFR